MSFKSRAAVLFLLISMLFASTASALGGERKGFFVGFNVGPAITSFTQTLNVGGQSINADRENKFGLGTDFRIGYAPSNQAMIYYTNKITWFSMENALGSNEIFVNGVGLLGVSYYMQPTHPSIYLTGTLGVSTWGIMDDINNAWNGFGLGAGFGYEFTKYWSVEAIVIWGNPGDSLSGIDVSTNAIGAMFTFGGTWY